MHIDFSWNFHLVYYITPLIGVCSVFKLSVNILWQEEKDFRCLSSTIFLKYKTLCFYYYLCLGHKSSWSNAILCKYWKKILKKNYKLLIIFPWNYYDLHTFNIWTLSSPELTKLGICMYLIYFIFLWFQRRKSFKILLFLFLFY